MTRQWSAAAALVLGLLACEESAGPSGRGTGGVALQILAAPAGGAALDSGYVRVSGPTNWTVKAVPGTTVTIAGNTVTATVTVGATPHDVAFSPGGVFAYVTSQGANNVSVIWTANNTVLRTISVPTPWGVLP